MALKQRLSLPFGRPSPNYREEDALTEFTKWIREESTRKYETGWALRVRDCTTRPNVQMLDGVGGADAGLANACDDDSIVGTGGYAEIWWAQRSQGRTVRLEWSRGSRPAQVTIGGIQILPVTVRTSRIAGRVTLAINPLVGLAGVTVTDGTRSTTTDTNGYYVISGVPIGETVTVTPSLTGYTMAPATESVTVSATGGESVDFVATAATVLVAVSSTKIARSTDDGATWVEVSAVGDVPSTKDFVAAGNGRFVMGGYGTHDLAYSDDGETWTGCGEVFGALGEAYDAVYDAAGDVWVAVGYTADATKASIARSTDNGETWTLLPIASVTGYYNRLLRVAVSGNRLVATVRGLSEKYLVLVSADHGQTWQGYVSWGDLATIDQVDMVYNAPGAVAVGPTGLIVSHAVGGEPADANVIITADTLGLTGYIDPTMGSLLHLVYMGAHSPDNRVKESLDVHVTSPAYNQFKDIIYDGTRFVSLGVGALGWIATATNGISWTNDVTTVSLAGLTSVTRIRYSGGRYFIAGTKAGANVAIAYSDDRVNWTIGTAAAPIMSTVRCIAKKE